MKVETRIQKFDIEKNTLRLQASSRGGGIEISLDKLGRKYKGHRMTAYQNYLGGGMLGRVSNDCTFLGWSLDPVLEAMADRLARYFHDLTNHEDDEWEAASFEENQKRSASAY